MRIIAVRVRPVCVAFSFVYGIAGLLAFVQYCFLEEMQQFTFPLGIFVPFVKFTFDLNLSKLMTASEPILYGIGATLAYAISGCLTALAATFLFNIAASVTGGIDARFVKVVDETSESAAGS